jgi:hypothetical protein
VLSRSQWHHTTSDDTTRHNTTQYDAATTRQHSEPHHTTPLRWRLMCDQSEWKTDSNGMPAMTFALFFKAVFELIGERWGTGVSYRILPRCVFPCPAVASRRVVSCCLVSVTSHASPCSYPLYRRSVVSFTCPCADMSM